MIKKIKITELTKILKKKLSSYKSNKIIINDIITSLISTSLRGIDSHGLVQIKSILLRLDQKRTQLLKKAKIVKQSANNPLILIDALNSPGQHSMMEGCRVVKKKTKKFGISYCIINNSTHFGACTPYIKYLADNGLFSIVGSNSAQSMLAFESTETNLGNNPIGFGCSVKNENLIVDFSTAVISFSKLNEMLNKKLPIPKSSFRLNKKKGNQIYEISNSKNYAALPFGGYKGASIAILVEIMSAVIGSGNFLEKTESYNKKAFYGPSHFILAIDPKKFNKKFFHDLHKYLYKVSKNKSLRIPGLSGDNIEKNRLKFGIPVEYDLLKFIS